MNEKIKPPKAIPPGSNTAAVRFVMLTSPYNVGDVARFPVRLAQQYCNPVSANGMKLPPRAVPFDSESGDRIRSFDQTREDPVRISVGPKMAPDVVRNPDTADDVVSVDADELPDESGKTRRRRR